MQEIYALQGIAGPVESHARTVTSTTGRPSDLCELLKPFIGGEPLDSLNPTAHQLKLIAIAAMKQLARLHQQGFYLQASINAHSVIVKFADAHTNPQIYFVDSSDVVKLDPEVNDSHRRLFAHSDILFTLLTIIESAIPDTAYKNLINKINLSNPNYADIGKSIEASLANAISNETIPEKKLFLTQLKAIVQKFYELTTDEIISHLSEINLTPQPAEKYSRQPLRLADLPALPQVWRHAH
jgi:hypothetical protein